jgi:hypothetical protein
MRQYAPLSDSELSARSYTVTVQFAESVMNHLPPYLIERNKVLHCSMCHKPFENVEGESLSKRFVEHVRDIHKQQIALAADNPQERKEPPVAPLSFARRRSNFPIDAL